MEDFVVYVDISREVVIYPNILSQLLERAVSEEDRNGRITLGPVPDNYGQSRSKDLVPIIIASSAGAAAIIYALSQLIDTYFHRPHHYEWDEMEEVRTGNEVIKGAKGQPVWKITRKHVMLEPKKSYSDHTIEFKTGTGGIVFRVSGSKK